MKTQLFDYDLPGELIAQEPAPRRDMSRLMLVERAVSQISHHRFHELPRFLEPGDCLVVNSTRVFPGRLKAEKDQTGGQVELLLLEKRDGDAWEALCRGASVRPDTVLLVGDGDVRATVLDGPREGRVTIRFQLAGGEAASDDALFELGTVPLPPYIGSVPPDIGRYQTVFGEREISAAAPTAGLHFTHELLGRLDSSGVRTGKLELAVGTDTFVPVREAEVEEHRIHSEWFSIDGECAGLVNETRSRGSRVCAVGTTVVRALESAAGEDGRVKSMSGKTDLYITPGYRFRAVDALLTNFHLPRSTLLMLVCAFGGTGLVKRAYQVAIGMRYRFYSFGDAMLLV